MKLTSAAQKELIKQLSVQQCTDEEIAEIVKIPLKKLRSLFSKTCEEGRALGRQQLRQKLYDLATATGLPVPGQANLLIWLSKQYLDMKDKQEIKQDTELNIIVKDYSNAG